MINIFFDKVFLINLDRRPDRLAECDTWLRSQGIFYERISAYDGQTLPGDDPRRRAELGCKLSHEKAIKYILQRGYSKTLILEDDFDPIPDLLEKFSEASKWVPSDWNQLYLGGNHQNLLIPVNKFVAKTKATATTHAYALNLNICEGLLEGFQLVEPVDTIYRIAQQKMNAYALTPNLINQKAGYSDIIQTEVNYDFMR